MLSRAGGRTKLWLGSLPMGGSGATAREKYPTEHPPKLASEESGANRSRVGWTRSRVRAYPASCAGSRRLPVCRSDSPSLAPPRGHPKTGVDSALRPTNVSATTAHCGADVRIASWRTWRGSPPGGIGVVCTRCTDLFCRARVLAGHSKVVVLVHQRRKGVPCGRNGWCWRLLQS